MSDRRRPSALLTAAVLVVAAGALLAAGCAAEDETTAAGLAAGLSDGELEGSEDNPDSPVDVESLGEVDLLPEPEARCGPAGVLPCAAQLFKGAGSAAGAARRAARWQK